MMLILNMLESNIKNKAISSIIWKFLERIIAQGTSFVVSLIIARILIPDDYSIISIIAIFFSFANVLISGGLNTALIQKRDADSLDYSTILCSSLIISLIIYLLLFLSAPIIANIYKKEQLIPIIRIMGFILPVTSIKSIYSAYISSHLEFRKFFYATLGGTIISAIIGICMAIKGKGPWALVVQQMTNTTIDTIILICFTKIGITLEISIKKFISLFCYSWKILISNLLGTLYMELSPLAIGIKYSAVDLAFYSKGKSFPALLSTASTNTLSAVLFPILAKFQDDKIKILHYVRIFYKISSFITFPIMMGLFGISKNFVLFILTEKWISAVYYIKIFCICSMFDIISVGSCETIKAIGRSDIYLIIEIVKKIGYFFTLCFFIYYSNTPEAIAIACCVCVFIQVIVNSIPIIYLIDYKLKYQMKDIIPNLISACIMCFSVLLIENINCNILIQLIMQIIIGIIIYMFLTFIINKEIILYFIKVGLEGIKMK